MYTAKPSLNNNNSYKGYYYYSRTEEGQQYRTHCRRALPANAPPQSEADAPREGAGAPPEEVLLDENARKAEGGHDFYMARVFLTVLRVCVGVCGGCL